MKQAAIDGSDGGRGIGTFLGHLGVSQVRTSKVALERIARTFAERRQGFTTAVRVGLVDHQAGGWRAKGRTPSLGGELGPRVCGRLGLNGWSRGSGDRWW
jgi:hypothetical protein